MRNRTTLAVVLVTLTLLSSSAFAYDFWGITLGTEYYSGASQLTFSGVGDSGAQYVVGGYKYTKVDSTWLGQFAAASPGASYACHRTFDAMGLFFKAEADFARFMIITGMPQTGATAADAGYGSRQFGPGDLKIDSGGNTYGVGLRLSNLLWAVDPNTSSVHYKIYQATGGVDSIFARDNGTLGDIELNPRWAHVDHYTMPANDERGFAFYVSGSGLPIGSADVAFTNTGVTLGSSAVYAYEAVVPWAALGINPGSFEFKASWRPDCGNDFLGAVFTGTRPETPDVPEPCSIVLAITGLAGLTAARRRKRAA